METGNLLRPWRERLTSPCFLPSKVQADSRRDGKPKALLPLSYQLLEGRTAAEQGLCSCRAVWECLAILEVHNPLLSLPCAVRFGEGILSTCFWAEAGTRTGFSPSLVLFSPPLTLRGGPCCHQSCRRDTEGVPVAYSQHWSPEGPSHGLALSCDLGAYAYI